MRLEYPDSWVVEATDDCVKVHDKAPPDADCALGVSYHRWPAEGQSLSVATLVQTALETDERSLFALGPIVEHARTDIDVAWGQGTFVDRETGRDACARLCLARKGEIQALLTFDFWASDLARGDVQWDAFLASLELGQWVADPRRGPSPP